MNIRPYQPADYHFLVELYKQPDQFKFDQVTDSKKALKRKIERDPETLLITEEDHKIVGSVSVFEDGRIALLFRLVALRNRQDIFVSLVKKAEEILKKRGFKEVHNTAPAGDQKAIDERIKLGFKKGKDYTWFWKRI